MNKLIALSVSFALGISQMAAAKNKGDAAEQSNSIAAAARENPFVNSLGMKFVPVPGTRALFSIWDTRVQDFGAFVRKANYNATGGMVSLRKKGEGQYGATWKNPGFKQGPEYPVVGVSWEDAKAFCAWLTKKERNGGWIGKEQEYRLPTDEEWSRAVGGGRYPWGNQWPPPKEAGNYAGIEARDADGPDQLSVIDGYRDPYPRTSPVGSFKANEYGLFDMGGNVCQWCEDWYKASMNSELLEKYPFLKDDGGGQKYRVFRGASWRYWTPASLLSSRRNRAASVSREDIRGFRCVLASVQSSR